MLKKVPASKTLVAAGDYAANDVLSDKAAYPGTAAALVFTFSGCAISDGRGGRIRTVQITLSKSGGITAITPILALLLYSSLPTSELYDNYPNTGCIAGDKGNYVGSIIFGALSNVGGSPETTYAAEPISFVCATNDKALYGILVTTEAITDETAGTVVTIDLYIEQDH